MVELKHHFPESFFVEEERLGFRIDRKRKEIWAVELDMLYELDRVCTKLGISYFLDGGTLIGAVRDGHIIPWDDDIDVTMLREDYDRFIHEAPKEFADPLFLQTGYNEKGYLRGHSQLRNSNTCAILSQELNRVFFNQGIFLDIFVIDSLFPEKVERQFKEREELLYQRSRIMKRPFRGGLFKRVAKQVRYWLYCVRYPTPASFYSRLENIFRSEEQSPTVDYLMFHYDLAQIHPLNRSWFEETIRIPFEGSLFPVPKGYHEYLSCYYEDYMTPKQAPSIHNAGGGVIFDTSRSYREVLEEFSAQAEVPHGDKNTCE
ncbi:MAG: LicD family protein [Oscillospiraceae bacterium]|nr:LicD family protein [Oscillospiraceae bacterium]